MSRHAWSTGWKIGPEYDLIRLKNDLFMAETYGKYEDGAFGHAISLPESGNDHYNNLPYTGIISKTPYFKEIYDSFETEVTSFRLLRRKAGTSYGIHNDRDMGDDIVRFQIPIKTNNSCWFGVTDCEMEEEYTEENSHTLYTFNKKFKPRFKNFRMAPAHIHTFNVRLNHSMFNEGDTDRITLSIDCKKNKWLDEFMNTFKEQK
jgi:hypothetical protein|tara:strand:+ start:324 stop:935 length:612 start_codon:yes stop_codon:yes gene_type:complete